MADRANLSGDTDGYGPTAPVGSFPDDVSPYGLFDAAGNAAEWVADWWDAEYYARSPERNPAGPASGDQRVHRAPIANAGGGPEKCRCVARYAASPNWDYGVRCVSVMRPEGEAGASPSAGTEAVAEQEQAAAAADDGIPRPLEKGRQRIPTQPPLEAPPRARQGAGRPCRAIAPSP